MPAIRWSTGVVAAVLMVQVSAATAQPLPVLNLELREGETGRYRYRAPGEAGLTEGQPFQCSGTSMTIPVTAAGRPVAQIQLPSCRPRLPNLSLQEDAPPVFVGTGADTQVTQLRVLSGPLLLQPRNDARMGGYTYACENRGRGEFEYTVRQNFPQQAQSLPADFHALISGMRILTCTGASE